MRLNATHLITSCIALSIFSTHLLANASSANHPSETATMSAPLRIPVEAELKRLMLAAERTLENQNYLMADSYLEKVDEYKAEKPSLYFYLKGMVQIHSNYWDKAKYNFEEYILRSTEEDKYYIKSLEMITYIESKSQPQIQSTTATSSTPEISWESNIQNTPQKDYINKIKSTYNSQSPKTALISHINMILESTPLTSSTHISGTEIKTFTSISLEDSDKIKVQKRLTSTDDTKISSFSTSVFGLSRDFISQCSANDNKCFIKHKDSLNTWFEINNDDSAAHELSEALSALIYVMQQN